MNPVTLPGEKLDTLPARRRFLVRIGGREMLIEAESRSEAAEIAAETLEGVTS